jgi:hypothetical protein
MAVNKAQHNRQGNNKLSIDIMRSVSFPNICSFAVLWSETRKQHLSVAPKPTLEFLVPFHKQLPPQSTVPIRIRPSLC